MLKKVDDTNKRDQMKYAHIASGCTLLKVVQTSDNRAPLDEQVTPYLSKEPNIVLDMSGIQLSSILIGELVNLLSSLRSHWTPIKPKIALLNLDEQGKRVLGTTKLDKEFPICADISAAFEVFSAIK